MVEILEKMEREWKLLLKETWKMGHNAGFKNGKVEGKRVAMEDLATWWEQMKLMDPKDEKNG